MFVVFSKFNPYFVFLFSGAILSSLQLLKLASILLSFLVESKCNQSKEKNEKEQDSAEVKAAAKRIAGEKEAQFWREEKINREIRN